MQCSSAAHAAGLAASGGRRARAQVAYVGDAANVSFSVTPAALRMPAAVRYAVVSQTGTAASAFIAPAALSGTLRWREEQGTALNLTLPVRALPNALSYCVHHQAHNALLPCAEIGMTWRTAFAGPGFPMRLRLRQALHAAWLQH